MKNIFKHPSAWIPIVLTFGILVVFFLYFFGLIPPDPTGDESTGAHLFQLWLVLEAFTVVVFALKWLPKKSRGALAVLSIQIVLALIPLAIVFSLHL